MVVAGGVESMSHAPWVMAKPTTAHARPSEVADTSIGARFINPEHLKHERRMFSMPEGCGTTSHLWRSRADQW